MVSELDSLIRELYSFRAVWRKKRHAEIVDALVSMGADAVPPLIAALETRPLFGGPPSEILFGAAQGVVSALGRIGDPRAVKALEYALREGGSNLKPAAAEALGLIGDPSAIPALAMAVDERFSEPTCFAAATALARLASSEDVPLLLSTLGALGGASPPEVFKGVLLENIRRRAVRSVIQRLGTLGDTRSIQLLLQNVEEECVVDALLQIGAAGAPQLITALGSCLDHVPNTALRALLKLDVASIEYLRQGLESSNESIACRSAIALCHLGVTEDSLIPFVARALSKRLSVSMALQSVRQLVRDSTSPSLRGLAAPLESISRDAGIAPNVRRECVDIVEQIGKQTDRLKDMPVASEYYEIEPCKLPRVDTG